MTNMQHQFTREEILAALAKVDTWRTFDALATGFASLGRAIAFTRACASVFGYGPEAWSTGYFAAKNLYGRCPEVFR